MRCRRFGTCHQLGSWNFSGTAFSPGNEEDEWSTPAKEFLPATVPPFDAVVTIDTRTTSAEAHHLWLTGVGRHPNLQENDSYASTNFAIIQVALLLTLTARTPENPQDSKEKTARTSSLRTRDFIVGKLQTQGTHPASDRQNLETLWAASQFSF